MGKRGPKATDAGLIYAWACDWFRLLMHLRHGVRESVQSFCEFARKDGGGHPWDWGFATRKGIPAEPEVLNALLAAQTPSEVGAACRQSKSWLDPETGGGPGSPHPTLPTLADAFLRAKEHPRYPRSERSSSKDKQLWFLAVALAAETWQVSLGRAINLLQAFSLRRPTEPKWWQQIIEQTGGIVEFSHPDGNYYTNGHQYWRMPPRASLHGSRHSPQKTAINPQV